MKRGTWMALSELLQYCVAQEVKIEFSFGKSVTDSIEMRACEGEAHFSRTFPLEEFTQHTEQTFITFLEEARRDLIRQRK